MILAHPNAHIRTGKQEPLRGGEGRTDRQTEGERRGEALLSVHSPSQSIPVHRAGPAPDGDISPQLCADLCPVCCVGNSWAGRSLTQRASLPVNWSGPLRKHLFGIKTHEVLLQRTHAHKDLSRVLGVSLPPQVLVMGFSVHLLRVRRGFSCHLHLLTPIRRLVSSWLTLQSPTLFQSINQTPNKAKIKHKIFQNLD